MDMDVKTAVNQRRTIRRFQNKAVSMDTLRELVDLSRMYASGGNLQPIRYAAVTQKDKLDGIFETLRWAAYLPGFEISDENRPMAYVVLACDRQVKRNCQFDVGAAATTLMLVAEEKSLGTCCLGSFNAEKVSELLELPENMAPVLVIALGYPAQKSRAVRITDDIKYYEDASGCLCVPKRALDEVLWVFQ